MKIVALETIRLEEFPNLLWLQIRTDEGVVGLGETFFLAKTVEAYIHEAAVQKLIGRDPLAIERIAKGPGRLSRLPLDRRGNARRLGDRHRAVGHTSAKSPASRSRRCSAASVATKHPHLQHLRRRCLLCAQAIGQTTANCGVDDPPSANTTISTDFFTAPTNWPPSFSTRESRR